MIPVVFIIGIFNLMLGFALALLLERQFTIPVPSLRAHRGANADDFLYELPAVAVNWEQVRAELPARWLALLESRGQEFSTFVEAAVEILSLEVDAYLENLLDAEDSLRAAMVKKNPDSIMAALQELVALNERWMAREREVLAVLAQKRDQLGVYGFIGTRFEGMLLDQIALIEGCCESMVKLDVTGDERASQTIISDLGNLVQMGHELRDALREATLTIICNENRLESSDERQHHDALTGLQNRMGIELLFKSWWRDDAQRSRHVSVALVDIDRFSEINNRLSTRVGDHFLRTISRFLSQMTAKENGLDRVFRYGGQSFFIFFGDTRPRSAATNIERIRQAIEATKFEYHGGQHSLTVRVGLTQVHHDDDTTTLFSRLQELTANAKRAGRNRTCLSDATGSGIVQPEVIHVKSRVVKVE